MDEFGWVGVLLQFKLCYFGPKVDQSRVGELYLVVLSGFALFELPEEVVEDLEVLWLQQEGPKVIFEIVHLLNR